MLVALGPIASRSPANDVLFKANRGELAKAKPVELAMNWEARFHLASSDGDGPRSYADLRRLDVEGPSDDELEKLAEESLIV